MRTVCLVPREHSPLARRPLARLVGHQASSSTASSAASSAAKRVIDNAFLVLGLTPRASWSEVARTTDALLASLEAGDPTVSTYDTPLGPQERTAGAVRVARARLRDPDARIQQEIWWEAPTRGPAPTAPEDAPWPRAGAAWGWRNR